MKQTAVEWLDEQIQERVIAQDVVARKMIIEISMEDYMDIKRQAKEREKEQIVNAHLFGLIHPLEMEATKQAEEYYNETYGGNHIVDTNEMIDHIGDANKMVEAVEKPMRYHCVPKEISDEEIEKIAKEKHIGLSIDVQNYRRCFMQGAKWYREQLKGGNK